MDVSAGLLVGGSFACHSCHDRAATTQEVWAHVQQLVEEVEAEALTAGEIPMRGVSSQGKMW